MAQLLAGRTREAEAPAAGMQMQPGSGAFGETVTDPRVPWISLLVLQPSPFCNIDCDYCYLPDRTSKVRMSMEVVAASIERIFAADLVRGPLSIVWHAGEPLAVPISYYEEAFAVIRAAAPLGAAIRHCLQSNGTLLNEAWCRFIKEHDISIGLSIDGPAEIHDAHRRTRSGRGTHEAAIRGLNLLRAHSINFHVISVVTAAALGHAEEIYEHFLALEAPQVGFNIEEIEGEHGSSSLDRSAATNERVKEFLQTIFGLQKRDGGRMRIREFDAALSKIQSGVSLRGFDFPYLNEQVRPFGIVSVDWAGNFSTYSPELLGATIPKYGKLDFGNVLRDDLIDALRSEKFQAVFADIQEGIRLCEATCAHYGFCGGGAPANKYYENGRFASAETMYCRYAVQIPLDIVLEDIESVFIETDRSGPENCAQLFTEKDACAEDRHA